jgi:hypothetical protein
MKTLQQRQEAFLLDGVTYYSADPVNRRCATKEQCFYTGKEAGKPQSEGCMIGRALPAKVAAALDEAYPFGNGIADIIEQGEVAIPNKILALKIPFLDKAQKLHDCDGNWDKEGLTNIGKKYLAFIIKAHGLNSDLFTKYLDNEILDEAGTKATLS